MTPEEFKAIRERLGWTQRATGEALGLDARSIRRYESGERAISKPAAILFKTIERACCGPDTV